MKSSKKLKDYRQIPSTPPPTGKKDRGVMDLEEELEKEKKYLCALCIENKELEEILQDYEREIAYVKSNFPEKIAGDKKLHASNEYWFKYESKMELIRKLEREKKILESEIRQLEEQGMINLDSLTQSELIMYVKQLERKKTNLLSDLRSKEWGLDKQAKDIHHLNETKRALLAEIRHYDKEFAMFRHYKKNSCPSASPTEKRRNSHATVEKCVGTWKQKDEIESDETKGSNLGDKKNSLSQENVSNESKSEIMFSSLDESKLAGKMESEFPDFRNKTMKGGVPEGQRTADTKKGPIKKTVAIGCLPELLERKSPSPRNGNSRQRVKGEIKVGTDPSAGKSDNRNPSKPIKIIVTYQAKRTAVAEKGETRKENSENEGKSNAEKFGNSESFRSIEEVYEDEFEEGEVERFDERKNLSCLTTRV